MRSKYFINNSLKREIEKNIAKREKINSAIDKNIKNFYNQVDPETINKIFDYVLNSGHPGQRTMILSIKERYENNQLYIEDTLELLDIYEEKFDELK